MTKAVPPGFCWARKRAVAMAQVKTCSSLDVDAQALQLGGHVAAGPLAVVGQEPERDVGPSQVVDEPVRAGDELAAAVDDAVHVDQIAKHRSMPPGCEIQARMSPG